MTNIDQSQEVWQGAGHSDQVQSVAWQWEGKLLASQAKDKTLRVWDPRSGEAAMEANSHEGVKDSKVRLSTNHKPVLRSLDTY